MIFSLLKNLLQRLNNAKKYISDNIKEHEKSHNLITETLRIRRKKLKINDEII